MRVELETAYVLHKRPYRNTSLLVEAFTHDYGRISLLAKGVRVTKNQKTTKASVIQPFNKLLISWTGKGELFTLIAVEQDGCYRQLTGNALYSGFYLNELLMRLLHRHDPHEQLFTYYEEALTGLYEKNRIESVLRKFEYKLLQEIGYGLQFENLIINGEKILDDGEYIFDKNSNSFMNAVATSNSFKLSGKCLRLLADEEFDDVECLKEMKFLMRDILTEYLGDKPIKSRELFQGSLPKHE